MPRRDHLVCSVFYSSLLHPSHLPSIYNTKVTSYIRLYTVHNPIQGVLATVIAGIAIVLVSTLLCRVFIITTGSDFSAGDVGNFYIGQAALSKPAYRGSWLDTCCLL